MIKEISNLAIANKNENEKKIQEVTLNTFFKLTTTSLFIFILINISQESYLMASVEFIFLLISILGLYFLRKNYNMDLITKISILALFISLISIVLIRSAIENTLLWSLIFPFAAMMLRGSKEGLYYSIVFYIIHFIILYDFVGETISLAGYIRFIAVSILFIIMAFVYESTSTYALNRLQTSLEDIDKLNAKLEQRVIDKTKKLQDSQKSLKKQYTLIQKILDTVPVRIFWKDNKSTYLGANKLFLEDAQLKSADEIIGKNDFDMPWEKTEAQLYREDDISVMSSRVPKINFEESQTDKEGNVITILTSKVLLEDENGNIIGVLGTYANISQQRNAENELQEQKKILHHQAHHDSLTGLPNRALFNQTLAHSIEKAKRQDTIIALLFIDLDHFKEINDSLGHDVGDEVLKEVTIRLAHIVRKEDFIARLGGDEFTVILENLTQWQNASLLAGKILEALAKPIQIKDKDLFVSCSIGISLSPNDGNSPSNLLKFADSAMYEAKAIGRNNYQYYDAKMTELVFQRVAMETSLRAGIKNEEFIVYYQPQIDGRNGKVIGMEALVRWNHPTMGIVPPNKFIPLAESTGLIIELDRYVMNTAIRQITKWYKEGLNPGVLAMNLAVKQLEKKDFIPLLKSFIKDIQCKPQWLELEVTESQIMSNPEESIKILKKIRDIGIELAVDDFGTGYSSLIYLKKLPIHKLKIDQAFIKDLPDNDEDVSITKAVIALAQSLNLKVIAEGVETKEQKDFLVSNGCNNIQGYYYSKPLPATEIENMLLKAK